MSRAKVIATGAAAGLLVLSLGGVGPAVAFETGGVAADAPGSDAVTRAAEADARGYIIVYPGDAIASSDAVFLETGPISRDTLVVVAEPDGSLPGGMTEADIAELVANRRAGENTTAANSGVTLSSQYAYSASSAAWSSPFSGTNLATGPGGTAVYVFDVSSGTSQVNAGQGLGYYYGYNGSLLGTWAKWYGLTAASSTSNGGGTVPWDNVLATQKFMAKCAASTLCGGYFWN